MERRKLYYSVILPIGITLGFFGCRAIPDVADSLKYQCQEINQNKDRRESWSGKAWRREILVLDEEIPIRNRWYKVTEPGKLEQISFPNGNLSEQEDLSITSSKLGKTNETVIDVIVYCSDYTK